MAPRRTAQVAITALLLLGCAYVLSPFFAAILFAGTVAITSWPLYTRLHGALRGRDGLAAITMTLLLTALLLVPMAGLAASVRELLPDKRVNPFPILCGTSAGAVNAVAMAVFSADFNEAVRKLAFIWRNFRVDHVYRADTLAIAESVMRWGSAVFLGWLFRQSPRSLLDNAPLLCAARKPARLWIDRSRHCGRSPSGHLGNGLGLYLR